MDLIVISIIIGICAFFMGSIVGYKIQKAGSLIKGIKSVFKLVRSRIVTYWYMIVFSVSTWYVLVHFDKCLEMTFTENFNGVHLIFVFWLVLIIFPFFDSFEGFGISLKKQKDQNTIDRAEAEFAETIANNAELREGGEHE